MGRERQERRQEEIRNNILDVARDIIKKEGIKSLSIRKIARAIEYSPGSIYHYFKDKDEIIKILVSEEYSQIIAAIGSAKKYEEEPEKEIKEIFMKYIKAALASPEMYKMFMLNADPTVLEKTGLLAKGISKKSQTMHMLKDNIERGIRLGRFLCYDTELTAQIFWTSTFGLIIKLMVEKNIPSEQVDQLIEHHFRVLFKGIMIP